MLAVLEYFIVSRRSKLRLSQVRLTESGICCRLIHVAGEASFKSIEGRRASPSAITSAWRCGRDAALSPETPWSGDDRRGVPNSKDEIPCGTYTTLLLRRSTT